MACTVLHSDGALVNRRRWRVEVFTLIEAGKVVMGTRAADAKRMMLACVA